jgi:GNAT superfamily N-acetyltransferase
MLAIRPALSSDSDAIWSILEPILRAGKAYTLPRDITREGALSFWFSPAHEVFVAHDDGHIVGTYFLRPNQDGGGSHVANCGYMTAPAASGRGVARAMCAHSLDYARNCGFRAMQFNFVVSITNAPWASGKVSASKLSVASPEPSFIPQQATPTPT